MARAAAHGLQAPVHHHVPRERVESAHGHTWTSILERAAPVGARTTRPVEDLVRRGSEGGWLRRTGRRAADTRGCDEHQVPEVLAREHNGCRVKDRSIGSSNSIRVIRPRGAAQCVLYNVYDSLPVCTGQRHSNRRRAAAGEACLVSPEIPVVVLADCFDGRTKLQRVLQAQYSIFNVKPMTSAGGPKQMQPVPTYP